jgi:hypothetical protein
VFWNGVIVHNRREVIGRTVHREAPTYAPHEPERPLELQDHGNPVRFRNIWIRRLDRRLKDEAFSLPDQPPK